MPNVCRAGIDTVGNGIILSGNNTVSCNGSPVAVVGSTIAPHPCCGGLGCDGHCSAVLVSGSSTVFVGGMAVCRSGDSGSCGHTANSSSNINIG